MPLPNSAVWYLKLTVEIISAPFALTADNTNKKDSIESVANVWERRCPALLSIDAEEKRCADTDCNPCQLTVRYLKLWYGIVSYPFTVARLYARVRKERQSMPDISGVD